ncbi:hypothetical protein [uncultured Helicobacter sp.]|uniref:hypothetical protein n=1 Tax=uncultured Helicobacter sp. TaxID=175537 RepID=UPI0037518E9F
MSHIPALHSLQLEAKRQREISQLIFEIYQALSFYFEKQKNPKIFMFYILLAEISLTQNKENIFFNILEMSYKYDVCEKTLKLWLQELERLEILKFNYKNKQLYFIKVLDYKQSKPYKAMLAQQAKTTQELPTRFYKNVAQIIRKVSKDFTEKEFIFDGLAQNERWHILPPTRKNNKLAQYKNIIIDFQNATDTNLYQGMTYENLTKKHIPSLKNPYHLRIIKANIKKSLELLSS